METTTNQTDREMNARDFKHGHQLFATSEEAWQFMRDCDAKGWRAGWPSREYPVGKPGAWFRVAFVVR